MLGKLMTGAAGVLLAIGLVGAADAAKDQPGDGKTVKMARATWDTGWFQAALYQKALEELGYEVERMVTLKNPAFYQAVGQGDVDLWVNGWFPLHNTYKDEYRKGATEVGYVAKGGALQGYLVDKKSAEKYGIKSLEDFKKDEVKKAFDANGDGKADMVACPPGWGCEKVIAHHMDAYELRDHVNPIKAGYAASMADALGRFEEGKPILFYTWTPNWTVGVLRPGKDVVWIEVVRPDLPEDQKQLEDKTVVKDLAGCVADPCDLGWPANDIRPVANKKFLEENPAARKLLEVMSVPLEDIFMQNARMNDGEDKKADLERHVEAWINENRQAYDGWIAEAKKAAM